MHKILAKTSVVAKKVVFLPSCHSTNDILSEMAKKGEATDGTVVITDHQTRGKGQGSNTWESQAGENLTFSVLLETGFLSLADQFFLNIITSLAISDALLVVLNQGVTVKWPNDIYYGEEKIGGILIQNTLKGNRHESSIIGIGLNVNQVKFSIPNATSLRRITARWHHIENLFESVVVHLDDYLDDLKGGTRGKLKRDYLERLHWLGEARRFASGSQTFNGVIKDIDEVGKLQLETESGLRTFDYQQITFIE